VNHDPDTAWLFLDVDDSVIGKDRVRTGTESFCEVQFTEFGIIRIQQQSELLLSSVFLKEEKNKVRLKLKKGNLLCKIDKLTKEEEFQVETGTVLAGVRGTEFMISETAGGDTVVAVNEGAVQIVPNEIAEKLEEMKVDLRTDTAKDILEEIARPEILVTEQKEVIISPKEVASAVDEFEKAAPLLEQKIRDLDKKAALFEEKERIIEDKPEERTARNLKEVEKLKDDIEELKEEMTSSSRKANNQMEVIINKIDPVSIQMQRELGDIDTLERRDFVIAAKKREKMEDEAQTESLYTKLTIDVAPDDARIYINGRNSGIGKFSGLYEPGLRLNIRVQRNGYKTVEKTVTVGEKQHEALYIQLHSPIVWRYRGGNASFVRRAALLKNRIVLASSTGELLCLSGAGEKLWTVPTANNPNENSMPVLSRQRVLFSGASEFVAVNMNSGEVVKRTQLEKEQFPSHIFGSPVVPFGPSILFPASEQLLLFDTDTLTRTRSIDVPGMGLGSPAPYGDRLVTINKNGELLLIDAGSGEVMHSIATGAFQTVGAAPSIQGDHSVFGDNRGTIVFSDLAEPKVVWERRIGTQKSSAVFQDITFGDAGVYPFTGDAIYALSLEKGEELFESVRSSCNPLYRDSVLYYGDNESSLVMMDAMNGRILKKYRLDSPITVTPVFYEDHVIVATRSGSVYLIDVESL
jgi:outer membrane protein assembly factor BamB